MTRYFVCDVLKAFSPLRIRQTGCSNAILAGLLAHEEVQNGRRRHRRRPDFVSLLHDVRLNHAHISTTLVSCNAAGLLRFRG